MKNNLFYIILSFFILHLNNACQYPVDVSELPDAEKIIFINAELTETYAKVSVTYTLDNVTPEGAYVFPKPPKATAYVRDGNGNEKFLKTDGVIDTSFKGLVGQTYTLHVEVDGKTYESNAETMRPCPELDSLTVLYGRELSRRPFDLLYDGFDVYAQFTDIAAQENFYQWEWRHYERRASCAETVINGQTFLLTCFPTDCWGIYYNESIIVQTDKLRDGKSIAQKIVRVPFVMPPSRYYLQVEQRSITPTVFAYLQSLQTQTQNVGSLFDIPAQTKFSPNIYNVEKPTDQVLGVFNVFSSRRKVVYVDMRQEIPGAEVKTMSDSGPFAPYPAPSAPCVEGQYRTQIRPEGWVD